MKPLSVTFFFRKSRAGAFSIENLFRNIQVGFTSRVTFTNHYLSRHSSGVIDRLLLVLEAYKHRGSINHVTGDINFVTLFLPASRTVLTIHDIESLSRSNNISNYLLRLFWLKLPISKAKYVTVVSETTKKRLLEQLSIPPEKVVVIPNVILDTFHFVPKAGITSKPVILQVGTKYNKNIERTIEALEGIDCHLVIVGPLTKQQKELLEKHAVTYSNYVGISEEELRALYIEADMVTFVSLFEGFGMPILEAQATGRPVITSNCSAMPEVAGEGGALFVDPYNVNEIRGGIYKLLNDKSLREALINKGLANCKRFSREAVAQQYLDLYHKLI